MNVCGFGDRWFGLNAASLCSNQWKYTKPASLWVWPLREGQAEDKKGKEKKQAEKPWPRRGF
jgi:hypothetical protein